MITKNFTGALAALALFSILQLSGCTDVAEVSTISNGDIVKKMYGDVEAGDIEAFLGVLDDQIEWNEAENFPYADGNPYIGAEAIMEGVFARLGAEWELNDGKAVKFQQYTDTYQVIAAMQP